MGGEAHRRIDEAGEHHAGIVLRPLPRRVRIAARERAVAGEGELAAGRAVRPLKDHLADALRESGMADAVDDDLPDRKLAFRSEEHTSELQSLMRISYAVFCLKKKTYKNTNYIH